MYTDGNRMNVRRAHVVMSGPPRGELEDLAVLVVESLLVEGP